MSKVRSALGAIVDFQLIAIKQQLAAKPVTPNVEQRRRFIDEKDGVRTTTTVEPNALTVGLEAAAESAAAESSEDKTKKK